MSKIKSIRDFTIALGKRYNEEEKKGSFKPGNREPLPFINLVIDLPKGPKAYNLDLKYLKEQGYWQAHYHTDFTSSGIMERVQEVKNRGMLAHVAAAEVVKNVDIRALYDELEEAMIPILKKVSDYYVIFRKLKHIYDHPQVQTAAVGWNPTLKKFELYIDRRFICENAIIYCLSGVGDPIIPHLIKKFNPTHKDDVFEQAILLSVVFVFLHEIGHIVFRHTGKKEDTELFENYDQRFVNHYEDVQININVQARIDTLIDTNFRSGIPLDPIEATENVDPHKITLTGDGAKIASYVLKGVTKENLNSWATEIHTPVPNIYLQSSIAVSSGASSYRMVRSEIDDDVPDGEFSGVLVINPFPLSLGRMPCIHMIKVIGYFLDFFKHKEIESKGPIKMEVEELGPPPEAPKEKGEPMAKQQDVEMVLTVGTVLEYGPTGKASVITVVHPDGTYDTQDLGLTPQEYYNWKLKELEKEGKYA